MTIIRQKKTANQCGQWSSFLEKKPRSSMLTFFFSPTQSIWRVNISEWPVQALDGTYTQTMDSSLSLDTVD